MDDATGSGVVSADDEAPVLGPGQVDHDGGALAVHGGEVLPEAAPAGPDGDHVREPGARGRMPRSSGQGSSTDADGGDGRERDPDVAVETLGLLHRAQVEHQLVTLDRRSATAGRV